LSGADSPVSCARGSVTAGRMGRRGEPALWTRMPALHVIGVFRWAGNPSNKKTKKKKKTESLRTSADVPVGKTGIEIRILKNIKV